MAAVTCKDLWNIFLPAASNTCEHIIGIIWTKVKRFFFKHHLTSLYITSSNHKATEPSTKLKISLIFYIFTYSEFFVISQERGKSFLFREYRFSFSSSISIIIDNFTCYSNLRFFCLIWRQWNSFNSNELNAFLSSLIQFNLMFVCSGHCYHYLKWEMSELSGQNSSSGSGRERRSDSAGEQKYFDG